MLLLVFVLLNKERQFADNLWTLPSLWKTCKGHLAVNHWFELLKEHNRATDRRRAAVIALLAARKFRADSHWFLAWVPRELVRRIAEMVMLSPRSDWENENEDARTKQLEPTVSRTVLHRLAEELEMREKQGSNERYEDLLARFFFG